MSPEEVFHPGSLPLLMNPPSPKGRPIFYKNIYKVAFISEARGLLWLISKYVLILFPTPLAILKRNSTCFCLFIKYFSFLSLQIVND